MAQPLSDDEMLTLEEAEEQYGVKRSTLYRYLRKGQLTTYRRVMDRRVYLRRAQLDALRRFHPTEQPGRPTIAAIERARDFQKRVFGDRVFTTTSAELIEEARRERTEELP